MHDTPPPTKFGDGSFNAELKDELSFHPAGGGRFHHRCVPAEAEAPFLAHVKVLRGNGDELVFEEHAEEAVITIELESDKDKEDAGNLIITGGPDYFQIDSDSKLKDPQPGAKGRQKYEHPGKGKSFHISRILVENPLGTVKLDEHAPDDHEEEYVIMVWHKGDDKRPRD
ncbi:MAG TPA: hypothetical protein VGQ39_22370 [Pyrinomonadaceae bacterium]|jgi:hypothetical protein|nr:hypothetical protein [Pyrinomonadaceae bacterium]